VNHNEQIKVTPPEEEEPTCERCFTTILTEEELNRLFAALISEGEDELGSLQAICEFIAANSQDPEDRQTVSDGLDFYGGIAEISVEKLNRILTCLEGVYGVDFPPIPTNG